MERQKISEYVEINAVMERWEEKGTKNRETWMYLRDAEGRGKKYCKVLYNYPSLKEERNAFKLWCKETALAMMIEESKKWKKIKTLYQVCPEMLCGDNPCSCESDEYYEK